MRCLILSSVVATARDDRSGLQVNWTPHAQVESRVASMTDRVDGSGEVLVGADFGLTCERPDVQVYDGLSTRF